MCVYTCFFCVCVCVCAYVMLCPPSLYKKMHIHKILFMMIIMSKNTLTTIYKFTSLRKENSKKIWSNYIYWTFLGKFRNVENYKWRISKKYSTYWRVFGVLNWRVWCTTSTLWIRATKDRSWLRSPYYLFTY